jgi:acyl-CoA reductase-like NAD-dependent aldehyde dehydrogenase
MRAAREIASIHPSERKLAATITTMTANGQSANGGSSSAPDYVVPLQINGQEEHSSLTHPVTNPSTNAPAWRFAAASKADALRAADAAIAAFPSWRKTKPSTRRDIFLRAADLLAERGAEYASYMELETGALPNFSTGMNIPITVAMLKDIAGRIVGELAGDLPICEEEGKSAMVVKEPYGVVLGIAPWNAPYILGMRSVAYALATGNTVVMKGSELSPRCHWAIGRLLADAGLPAGCLNVVYHRPQDAAEITTALIEHKAIRKVNFTGSTAVGAIISAIAGKNLKPCLMELGGKNCAIVLEDADLDEAAKACVLGAFYHVSIFLSRLSIPDATRTPCKGAKEASLGHIANPWACKQSGQICMSTDLIFCARPVASRFKALLADTTSAMFPSDQPSSVLVTPAGTTKVKDIILNALDRGANAFHGDARAEQESDTRLRPVLLEGVKEDMDMYSKEAFGPTAAVLEVDSADEAVRIMNESDYGLSASVFSRDLARALRVAKEIESG